MGGMGGMY